MKTLVHYSKRPYVYAGILTLGMAFLYSILHTSTPRTFFLSVIALYLLLIFELFSTKYYATGFDEQYQLENKDIKHKRAHWVHHFIMPTLLYLSMTSFLFVNAQLDMFLLVMVLSLFLFAFLFINIKAYYERKFKLERDTANVYDIISIAVVFMASYSILVGVGLTFESYIIAGLLIGAVILVMGYLTLSRYHLIGNRLALSLFALVALYINLFLVLLNFEINLLSHTLISTFAYYYYTALISHIADKNLSMKIFTEYLAVFALIFVIILLGHI